MAQEASEFGNNITGFELKSRGRESEIVRRDYKVKKSYNGRLLAAFNWLLLLLFRLSKLILIALSSRLILALSKPKRGSKRNEDFSPTLRSSTSIQRLKMKAIESKCSDWQYADELSLKLLWEAIKNPRLAEVNESQVVTNELCKSIQEPLEKSQVEEKSFVDTMQVDQTNETSNTQQDDQQDGQFEVVDKETDRNATQTDELECELQKDCGETNTTDIHACNRTQLSISSSGNSSAEIAESSGNSSGAEESQGFVMDSKLREDSQFIIKCDGSLSSEAEFEEDLKLDDRHLSDLYDVKFVKRSGSSLSNFRRTLVCSLSPTSQLSGSNSDLTSTDQTYPIEDDEILQCRAAFRQNKRLIEEQQKRANSPIGISPQSPIRFQTTNRFNIDYLEKCSHCQQRLYPTDKMELDFTRATLNIHRNCFKCHICSSLLRLETYAAVDAKLYCPAHIKCITSSR